MGNGFKLKESRFRIDNRKKFFTMMVVRHWSRMPGEAVTTPLLEVFKAGFFFQIACLGMQPRYGSA